MLKSKKSRSWFSCSFFLRSLQATCPNNCSGAAGTPGAAGESFRTIVPTQVWQPGKTPILPGSRASSSEQLFTQDGCPAREIPIPAAVPGEPAAVPNNCTISLLVKPDPDPDSGGDYLPEAEQFPRLRPDPAPITPIPLRSEQFFGHRSHTLCK